MKVLVSFLLLAVAAASNTTEQDELPDNIITNGYTAAQGVAPYIVYLSFQNGRSFCGGSIIGNRWVVTASHCTKPYNSVTIYYGSLQSRQGQIVHTVTGNNIINHPVDDIALIRTPHVNFSNTINRIRIPRQADAANRYEGQWGLACGWGQTTTSTNPDRLQCVNLQIITHAVCSRTYGRYVNERHICVATPGGRSICFGDSGGPLTAQNNTILVGVSNFVSARGCTAGDPAAFARVSSHLNWIRQHTGISY